MGRMETIRPLCNWVLALVVPLILIFAVSYPVAQRKDQDDRKSCTTALGVVLETCIEHRREARSGPWGAWGSYVED
jgi:hypothetical protein